MEAQWAKRWFLSLLFLSSSPLLYTILQNREYPQTTLPAFVCELFLLLVCLPSVYAQGYRSPYTYGT